jgi:hypothetical protein
MVKIQIVKYTTHVDIIHMTKSIGILIPILLLSTSVANAAEYNLNGLRYNTDQCNDMITTDAMSDCKNGFPNLNQGPAYHTGYHQGLQDSLIGLHNPDMCLRFILAAKCDVGYFFGYHKGATSPTAVAAMKQTSAYRAGWIGGLRNEGISLACDPYIGRDEKICLKGHDDAVLSLGFSKSAIYKQGFEYGKRAAEGKETLDRFGDCSYDPADTKKTQTCKSGWNAGWDSVKHPRPNY